MRLITIWTLSRVIQVRGSPQDCGAHQNIGVNLDDTELFIAAHVHLLYLI